MSTTTTSHPATSSPLKRLITRHPLLSFFALAFGLTWPLMIVDALGSWDRRWRTSPDPART